ncbi:penicillin acylase family protein [Virgibacillus proomii]|nr:penicillin acylase family protein [Virgibacillus proomii]
MEFSRGTTSGTLSEVVGEKIPLI